jgi:hypothetical protein
VHFDKLACTACHSGPWPSSVTYRVKTSRAHALGIPKADKADDALPHIATPVFAQQADGKYAPHDLFWPAFWAYQRENDLAPVAPDLVRPLVTEILGVDTTRSIGRWPVLRDAEILAVLRRLHQQDSAGGNPVYVSAGRLFTIGSGGVLARQENEAAKPYAWPIAHDVRPKARSLGVRGCNDCHATDAPFHFGVVTIASPYVVRSDSLTRMTEYQDKGAISAWLFAVSFLFRPGLKLLIILCFLLIASVVLIHALRGLAHIIRTLAADEE